MFRPRRRSRVTQGAAPAFTAHPQAPRLLRPGPTGQPIYKCTNVLALLLHAPAPLRNAARPGPHRAGRRRSNFLRGRAARPARCSGRRHRTAALALLIARAIGRPCPPVLAHTMNLLPSNPTHRPAPPWGRGRTIGLGAKPTVIWPLPPHAPSYGPRAPAACGLAAAQARPGRRNPTFG